MMAEGMLSPEDRDELKRRIGALADELEAEGFDLGHVAAAMAGFGVGTRAALHGAEATLAMLAALEGAIVSQAGRSN